MKRGIVGIVMACVILGNAVFTQAVLVSAKSTESNVVLSGMYKLNDTAPLETEYNDENTPHNFSVTEKVIAGNTKHYLTWRNEADYNNSDVKVEVYAQVILKYIDTDDFKMSADELQTAVWEEYNLPVVRCCLVNASECGAYINFSDLWNTLESISDADFEFYNNLLGKNNWKDYIAHLLSFDGVDWSEKVETQIAKTRYALANSKTANYIKYSRVKYFIRYVYGDTPSALYGVQHRFIQRYEYYKGNGEPELYFKGWYENKNGALYCAYYDSDKVILISNEALLETYIRVSNNEVLHDRSERDCRLMFLDGLRFDSIFDAGVYDIEFRYDGYIFVDEESALAYLKTGIADLNKIAEYKAQYYRCGKVIENDAEVTGPNIPDDYEEVIGPVESSELPYPWNKIYESNEPENDIVVSYTPIQYDTTGADEDNTDVVYWLKKVYSRLGVMLGVMVVDDVVDGVKNVVNQKIILKINTHAGTLSKRAMNKFPFSMLFFMRSVIAMFKATPREPEFKIMLGWDEMKLGNVQVEAYKTPLKLDFSDYESFIEITRYMIMIAFCYNLGVNSFGFCEWLRKMVKK